MRAALIGFILAAGCGAGGPADPDPGDERPLQCPTEGRYFPMTPGATWTFRVTDDGDRTTKVSTVGALEDVGGDKAGIMAFRVTTSRPDVSDETTVSWQEDTGTAIRRHHEIDMSGTRTEEWYQPHKLRLDESAAHVADGATWSESYTELVKDVDSNATTTSAKTEQWIVEAAEDVVSVPAGRFCALRVRRTTAVDDKSGSDKTYWFVHGIGKVKETGGKTEELVEYSIPARS